MHDKTVCIDFDGVIHPYLNGWKGVDVFEDKPVDGAREAIAELKAHGYHVVVQSARARIENGDGKKGIEDFLALHGIIVDEVTNIKPPSFIYIDDRGFRFKGDWREVLDFIHSGLYHPWNNVQKP